MSVSWLSPWRKSDAVMRFVQVLRDVLALVQRKAALGLRRPARHHVAQVGEILDFAAQPVVHALVVAAAAVRLVEQAAALDVLRRGGEGKEEKQQANAAHSYLPSAEWW